MNVAICTTSWPSESGDHSGRFVADGCDAVTKHSSVNTFRFSVVEPRGFRSFGVADAQVVVAGIRKKPWVAPLFLFNFAIALRRTVKNESCELIQAHWLLTCVVARFGGAPFVVTLHGSGTAGRWSDIELIQRHPRFVRWLLYRAAAVLCVSERLEAAVKSLKLPESVKVCVVRNPIDLPDGPSPRPHEPPHALFVGRLSHEKGVDVLAEALADNGKPLFDLRIVGDGPMRNLFERLGIIVNGFQPHNKVFDEIDAATLVVLPSRREGLPMTALEAFARRRAVVCTPAGGLTEVVHNGETGIVVPIEDALALRGAITELLEDPSRANAMGDRGRLLVEKEFSQAATAHQLVSIYSAAVAKDVLTA